MKYVRAIGLTALLFILDFPRSDVTDPFVLIGQIVPRLKSVTETSVCRFNVRQKTLGILHQASAVRENKLFEFY